MSKKIKLIMIVSIFISLIILGIIFIKYFKNDRNENSLLNKENLEQKTEEIIEKEEEKVSTYIDDNPITIGLYVKDGNYKKLVKEYYCGWDPEEVLGIFYAVYTNDEIISNSNFNNVWKEYLNNYTNIDKYRIGYNIKFTMDTGEIIDQIILNPDHAYLMYPEIQFYLYDDINLVPGKRYYHVTSDEMNENTICSSVKLVGDKKTPNIISDIELTVFTYDSSDDFDPNTGKYRGNSHYTVIIKRK